jgi:hypothetical protein
MVQLATSALAAICAGLTPTTSPGGGRLPLPDALRRTIQCPDQHWEASMTEVRAVRAEDVAGIAAIDPDSLGSADEIRALVQGEAS